MIYDFCESRAGAHARAFLQGWQGSLVCDDFPGYKALMAQGITEIGCLAKEFFYASEMEEISGVRCAKTLYRHVKPHYVGTAVLIVRSNRLVSVERRNSNGFFAAEPSSPVPEDCLGGLKVQQVA